MLQPNNTVQYVFRGNCWNGNDPSWVRASGRFWDPRSYRIKFTGHRTCVVPR